MIRGYPLYDSMLKISLRPFDAIATGSELLATKLRESSVDSATIRSIPWAVSLGSLDNNDANNGQIRSRLGLAPGSRVILWSGFISSVVGEDEFQYSVRTAKRILAELKDVEFVFVFKRPHFRNEYKQLESSRIKVVYSRSRAEFLDLVRISTLLLSLSFNRKAIVGVPLSWLECMALGVPVVTTNIQGIDESIVDGKNGIVMSDINQASEILRQLLRDPSRIGRLSHSARKTVEEKFEIRRVAKEYLSLWSSVVQQKGR